MKGLELTLVAAIAATMLTSSAFAQASHRNDDVDARDKRGHDGFCMMIADREF